MLYMYVKALPLPTAPPSLYRAIFYGSILGVAVKSCFDNELKS